MTIEELEAKLETVSRERDEAQSQQAIASANYVVAMDALETATRGRDEARAEVERLGTALTQETRLSLHPQRQLDEARAEVARLDALSVKREVMLDKLRWVSQEARAAVMLGYTGPNHETLRKALAQLTVTEDKP